MFFSGGHIYIPYWSILPWPLHICTALDVNEGSLPQFAPFCFAIFTIVIFAAVVVVRPRMDKAPTGLEVLKRAIFSHASCPAPIKDVLLEEPTLVFEKLAIETLMSMPMSALVPSSGNRQLQIFPSDPEKNPLLGQVLLRVVMQTSPVGCPLAARTVPVYSRCPCSSSCLCLCPARGHY